MKLLSELFGEIGLLLVEVGDGPVEHLYDTEAGQVPIVVRSEDGKYYVDAGAES